MSYNILILHWHMTRYLQVILDLDSARCGKSRSHAEGHSRLPGVSEEKKTFNIAKVRISVDLD